MKKFISVLLALVIGCSCAVCAFAADTATSYTVTYKTNVTDTAVTAPAAVTVTSGTAVVLADAPAYSGYAFKNWNTAADGTGTAYSAKDSLTVSADIILYAQWVKTYTVTYKTNVTDTNVKAPDAATVTSGSTVTLAAAPAYTGYTFAGWNTTADGKGTNYAEKATVSNVTSDLAFYAQWKKNDTAASEYTLTVITKGGTSDVKTETKLKAGDPISFDKAVQDGFYLVGIYEDEACTKENTYKTMPEKNVTLYAKVAVKLSKLSSILGGVDMASVVKATGLSEATFNAKADELGFVIKYTINGKQYTVKEFTKFCDEIVAACKTEIAYEKTGTLSVQTQQGRNAQSETISYLVYNDIKEAATDTTAPVTSDTTVTSASTDLYSETQTATSAAADTSDQAEVPSTGSTVAKAVVSLVALTCACAAVTITVISKKKKDETEA